MKSKDLKLCRMWELWNSFGPSHIYFQLIFLTILWFKIKERLVTEVTGFSATRNVDTQHKMSVVSNDYISTFGYFVCILVFVTVGQIMQPFALFIDFFQTHFF